MSDITVKATVPPEITSATAKENGRYSLACVQIRKLPDCRALLAATDGSMLAVRECEAEMMVDRAVIPASVLRKSGMPIQVECNGVWTAAAGKASLTAPIEDVQFPPIEQIMPDPTNRPIRIALNAALLAKLAKAISSEGFVTLGVPSAADERCPTGKIKGGSAFIVEGDKGVGVLMPALVQSADMREYARIRDLVEGRAPKARKAKPAAKPDAAADADTDKPEPDKPTTEAKPARKPKAAPPPPRMDQSKLREALAALGAA